MASINTQLKALDAKLDELADPRMKLLQSLKGVGPRTAEAVVLYIDDPKRFKNGEELASYAGPGSQATAKRGDEPTGPHHPSRAGSAAVDAGGGSMDDLSAQPLGTDVCEQDQPRLQRPGGSWRSWRWPKRC